MKRPLFVFAGQSNMMGAPVFEVGEQIYYKNSAEYLHKRRRFGESCGEFKTYGFPVGEFVYTDLVKAYQGKSNPNIKSTLNDYSKNVYFGAAMSNLLSEEEKTVYPFAYFSEENNRLAPSMPPFIVKDLEENGYFCAYIPSSWSDITFDTGAVYGKYDYGRLILRFNAEGDGVINNTGTAPITSFDDLVKQVQLLYSMTNKNNKTLYTSLEKGGK